MAFWAFIQTQRESKNPGTRQQLTVKKETKRAKAKIFRAFWAFLQFWAVLALIQTQWESKNFGNKAATHGQKGNKTS